MKCMANKLLMIDENSRLLTLIGDFLSNLGYEVHRASECDEAKALLENYQYSIVIAGTDWEDFGGLGKNLTQHIKELTYSPPVVYLKESQSSLHTPALDDNATLVIEKPISLLYLGDLVHEITSI
jgi:DNA-binding NtrC family response regulator